MTKQAKLSQSPQNPLNLNPSQGHLALKEHSLTLSCKLLDAFFFLFSGLRSIMVLDLTYNHGWVFRIDLEMTLPSVQISV